MNRDNGTSNVIVDGNGNGNGNGTSHATEDRGGMLTRSEVARLLGVCPSTVARWAREGRVPSLVTLGGHHRFERQIVETLRADLARGTRAGAVGERT